MGQAGSSWLRVRFPCRVPLLMDVASWEEIVAELHYTDDSARAVAARYALDLAADSSRLPQLHHLLLHGRDFFIRETAAEVVARLEGLRALPQLLEASLLGI